MLFVRIQFLQKSKSIPTIFTFIVWTGGGTFTKHIIHKYCHIPVWNAVKGSLGWESHACNLTKSRVTIGISNPFIQWIIFEGKKMKKIRTNWVCNEIIVEFHTFMHLMLTNISWREWEYFFSPFPPQSLFAPLYFLLNVILNI